MKRIVLMVLAVVVMATVAFADEYSFDRKAIKVDQKKEYLEITISNKDVKEPMVYRIWPCGKVEEMQWKELSGNKERSMGWYSGQGSLVLTPGNLTSDQVITIH